MMTIDNDLDTPLEKAVDLLLPNYAKSTAAIKYSANLLLCLAHLREGNKLPIEGVDASKIYDLLSIVLYKNYIIIPPKDKNIFSNRHLLMVQNSALKQVLEEFFNQEYQPEKNRNSIRHAKNGFYIIDKSDKYVDMLTILFRNSTNIGLIFPWFSANMCLDFE